MEEPVVTGMTEVITALNQGITAETIFAVVADVIPFVVTMVPIALGIYFLRKLIKGAGKAKVRF